MDEICGEIRFWKLISSAKDIFYEIDHKPLEHV